MADILSAPAQTDWQTQKCILLLPLSFGDWGLKNALNVKDVNMLMDWIWLIPHVPKTLFLLWQLHLLLQPAVDLSYYNFGDILTTNTCHIVKWNVFDYNSCSRKGFTVKIHLSYQPGSQTGASTGIPAFVPKSKLKRLVPLKHLKNIWFTLDGCSQPVSLGVWHMRCCCRFALTVVSLITVHRSQVLLCYFSS